MEDKAPPTEHPVLGLRKVKEVIAVTVVLYITDTPVLGPASSGFALLLSSSSLPSSSPPPALLLEASFSSLRCHLLRKTIPDHPV